MPVFKLIKKYSPFLASLQKIMSTSTPLKRLLLLSQTHRTFRYPELVSIGKIFNFPPNIFPESKKLPDTQHCLVVNLTDLQLSQLMSRAMSIQQAFDLYGEGSDHWSMLGNLSKNDLFKERYYNKKDQKLAFKVVGVNKKLSNDKKRQIGIYMKTFDYHPQVVSQIDLDNPDKKLFFVEVYSLHQKRADKVLEHVYWVVLGVVVFSIGFST